MSNLSFPLAPLSFSDGTATAAAAPVDRPADPPAIATPPSGSVQVLPTIVVTAQGSHIGPSPQDEATFAYYSNQERISEQTTLDEARVNAERWQEQLRQEAIPIRARQIEDAQFAMLGQGLIGAGKSVVNNLANLTEAIVGGPGTMVEQATGSLPPALPYSNADQAGAGNAMDALTVVAGFATGGLEFATPKLGTAYDAAAAWLSDAVDTISARFRASADLNAQAALQASVPDNAATLTYKPTSGVLLQAQEGSTTTILGSYNNDMRSVVGELGNVKSTDFGPRVGGFNVLNVPDELNVSPKQFWTEYNQPWLSNAIDRGDNFLMATRPAFDVTDARTGFSVLTRPNPVTGQMELSGFGREYLMMRRAGYVYQDGAMVK